LLEAGNPARRAGDTFHKRTGSTIAVPSNSLLTSADSSTRAGFTHPAFVLVDLSYASQIRCNNQPTTPGAATPDSLKQQ